MKQLKIWAKDLPNEEGLRDKFLINAERYETLTAKFPSLNKAIWGGFDWSDTLEGFPFWKKIETIYPHNN